MAHELDVNTTTGIRSMFSTRLTPWHHEGVVLPDAPDYATALRLAGADYDVVLRELHYAPETPVHMPGADIAIPSTIATGTGYAVVRRDRGNVLGIVGDSYTPLQNRDAFGVLEPLLDRGVASLETGGTLRDGRDAWMLVRFNIDDAVVRETFADEVVPFGLVTNNHSGESRAMVMQTPIRVVCANTLGQAMVGWKDRGDVIAIGHKGDAKLKVVEAAEQMFGSIVDRYRTIAEQYAAMKARILTVQEFERTVLDKAAPLPPALHTPAGEHLTIRGYDLALDAATARRAAITTAWDAGSGHRGDRSAWEAYNAAVEVIDHDSTLFRTRGSRVAAMIGGSLLERKSLVLNAVAALCRN